MGYQKIHPPKWELIHVPRRRSLLYFNLELLRDGVTEENQFLLYWVYISMTKLFFLSFIYLF